jgi:hypothetical protein
MSHTHTHQCLTYPVFCRNLTHINVSHTHTHINVSHTHTHIYRNLSNINVSHKFCFLKESRTHLTVSYTNISCFYMPAFKNVGVLCYTTAVRLSVLFTLTSQLLLNPYGDFDETWHKERSHCGDVHTCIVRGALSNYFSRSYGLWT